MSRLQSIRSHRLSGRTESSISFCAACWREADTSVSDETCSNMRFGMSAAAHLELTEDQYNAWRSDRRQRHAQRKPQPGDCCAAPRHDPRLDHRRRAHRSAATRRPARPATSPPAWGLAEPSAIASRDDLANFASHRDFLHGSQHRHTTGALIQHQTTDIQVDWTKDG